MERLTIGFRLVLLLLQRDAAAVAVLAELEPSRLGILQDLEDENDLRRFTGLDLRSERALVALPDVAQPILFRACARNLRLLAVAVDQSEIHTEGILGVRGSRVLNGNLDDHVLHARLGRSDRQGLHRVYPKRQIAGSYGVRESSEVASARLRLAAGRDLLSAVYDSSRRLDLP